MVASEQDLTIETLTKARHRMATDCEKLSDRAQEIFDKFEPHFPLDPFKEVRWKKEGSVHDNTWFNLRKSADRDRLIESKLRAVGYMIEITSRVYQKEKGSLEGFDKEQIGMAIIRDLEVLHLLHELDFQIETGDIVGE